MRDVGGRDAALRGLLAQPREGALEHRVRVGAAHHLLGVGHQLPGPQDVLHEPLDGAVGEVLERAGGDRLGGAELLQQRRRRQALGEPLDAPRAGGGVRALELGGGRGVLGAPGDVRQRPLRLRRARLEQVAHVLDEEGLRLGVALLVAAAARQDEQALGARAGRRRTGSARGRAGPRAAAGAGRSRAAIARRSSSGRNGSGAAPVGNSPSCRPQTKTASKRRARIASGSATCTRSGCGGSPRRTRSSLQHAEHALGVEAQARVRRGDRAQLRQRARRPPCRRAGRRAPGRAAPRPGARRAPPAGARAGARARRPGRRRRRAGGRAARAASASPPTARAPGRRSGRPRA